MVGFKEEIKMGDLFFQVKKLNIELMKIIFNVINENRSYLEQYLDWVEETKSLDNVKSLFLLYQKGFENNVLINYSIFFKEEYIGDFAIFNINFEEMSCEIGYWIVEKYSNKGLATKIIKIFEKELFENLKFNKILLKSRIDNTVSNYLAKKLDYKLCSSKEINREKFNFYEKTP